jgi:hypothetical protein
MEIKMKDNLYIPPHKRVKAVDNNPQPQNANKLTSSSNFSQKSKTESTQSHKSTGLGSNGTANRLKVFLLFLMTLTNHVLPHLAWRRNIDRAY